MAVNAMSAIRARNMVSHVKYESKENHMEFFSFPDEKDIEGQSSLEMLMLDG